MPDAVDMINHPPHYAGARWETIEIIEALGNQFRLGNALKYIFRHKKKGGEEDLKKARWYLEREFRQSKPARSSQFDAGFWRAHGDEFAGSFGIEDAGLVKTIAWISMACLEIWQEDESGWRRSVHSALVHLNAYLVPVDLNPESPEAA